MSATTDILIKDLAKKIVDNQNKKPSAYDTSAEVRRIEGDTAWVHIPGGVDETPVQLTMNAKKGDIVQVRVSGGKAWITGNSTSPPTDDTKAKVAEVKAEIARTKAISAEEIADGANVKADNASQKADRAIEAAEASITTDTLHYLATSLSSGVTINTSGWTTTIQTMTSEKRYLWTYHTYHKASGQSINTSPIITGVYGQTGPSGDDGVSVTMVQPYYCLSTSNSQLTGTEVWGTSIPTPTDALPYIWTKDLVTFSNSTSSYSTAVYNEALTYAVSTAEEALTIAEGIDEHFWYDNTGAHVTRVTQEEWNDTTDPNYHKGGNTLITSEGMGIRDGLTELASFGAAGATIGQNGQAKTIINYNSVKLKTKEDFTVFSAESKSGQSKKIINIPIGIYLKEYSVVNDFYPSSTFYNLPNGTEFSILYDIYQGSTLIDSSTIAAFTKGTSREIADQRYGLEANYNGYSHDFEFIFDDYDTGNSVLIKYLACIKNQYDGVITVYGDMDCSNGYKANDAQIGSFISMKSETGSPTTLSTSYKNLNISEIQNCQGNAFLPDGQNGIICNYDGIVLVSGCVWAYNGFTTNDIIYAQIYNKTQDTALSASRLRVYQAAPNTYMVFRAQPSIVNSGDVIKLRAQNATGSRGVIADDGTTVSLVYLAPILT